MKKSLKLLEIIILYASKYGDFLQCACKKNEKNCPDLDDWLLVTLRARLCNHLKSCNLPKDKNAGVLARLCKNSNTKSHKKVITKNVIARSASIFTV